MILPFTLYHCSCTGSQYCQASSTLCYAGKMPLRVFGLDNLDETDWKSCLCGVARTWVEGERDFSSFLVPILKGPLLGGSERGSMRTELNFGLWRDREDAFTGSGDWSSSYTTGTILCSKIYCMFSALQSGSRMLLNLGGRYLCSSYSLIRVNIFVQVLVCLSGEMVAGSSERRWFWSALMSFARRELQRYSSRRVGKPLYIDINDYRHHKVRDDQGGRQWDDCGMTFQDFLMEI